MSSTEAFGEIVRYGPASGAKKGAAYRPIMPAEVDYFRKAARSIFAREPQSYIVAHVDVCDASDMVIDPVFFVHLAGEAPRRGVQATPSEQQPRDKWPKSSSAYDHARAEIRSIHTELRRQGLRGVSELAASSMRHALRDVLATDSIYPSLSLDEDGSLLAEWRYGDEAIEVEATVNGAVSWAHFRDGRLIKSSVSRAHLRRILRDLTAGVEAANPNWRSLFRTHSHR